MPKATEVYKGLAPYFCGRCGQIFAKVSKGHQFGYPHPASQLVLWYCGRCDVWLEAPEFAVTAHTYVIDGD